MTFIILRYMCAQLLPPRSSFGSAQTRSLSYLRLCPKSPNRSWATSTSHKSPRRLGLSLHVHPPRPRLSLLRRCPWPGRSATLPPLSLVFRSDHPSPPIATTSPHRLGGRTPRQVGYLCCPPRFPRAASISGEHHPQRFHFRQNV